MDLKLDNKTPDNGGDAIALLTLERISKDYTPKAIRDKIILDLIEYCNNSGN